MKNQGVLPILRAVIRHKLAAALPILSGGKMGRDQRPTRVEIGLRICLEINGMDRKSRPARRGDWVMRRGGAPVFAPYLMGMETGYGRNMSV